MDQELLPHRHPQGEVDRNKLISVKQMLWSTSPTTYLRLVSLLPQLSSDEG